MEACAHGSSLESALHEWHHMAGGVASETKSIHYTEEGLAEPRQYTRRLVPLPWRPSQTGLLTQVTTVHLSRSQSVSARHYLLGCESDNTTGISTPQCATLSAPLHSPHMEHFCEHSKPLAVHCRQLTFGYKAKCPVIDGLSMSVPSASIYSLLGSSSAGKTTLLKLISATHQAQKGDIYLFGERLGDKRCSVPGKHVGYMPQDLCLYPKFSIKETLQYFARINDVKSDEIEKRIKYFKEYLELPSVDKPIHRLSGGQQRRVSLAAALIHSPALLLLDEPTVGIDPLLRYKIWNYFYNLRNKGQTVSGVGVRGL